jgi:hypothetical protein
MGDLLFEFVFSVNTFATPFPYCSRDIRFIEIAQKNIYLLYYESTGWAPHKSVGSWFTC